MRRRARQLTTLTALAALTAPMALTALMGLTALCVAVLGSIPLAPAAAAAGPTSVTLHGPGLAAALTVRATDDPELFKDLLSEVSWLATRPGSAPQPDAAKLGPGYQLTVLVDEAPDQVYELYPLAVGGPRVFRPAKQPRRTAPAAWFYGRLSMPETLRDAGVPLVLGSDGGPGGAGGGAPAGQGDGGQTRIGTVTTASPGSGIGGALQQWQRSILLLGGGALVLLLLLAGAALLVRRP